MHSFFSRVLVIIIVFLIGCGLIVALLPKLASTDWGRKKIVEQINHRIPGQIEIRSLNLRWGKGQQIEGILLKDPSGQSVLGIEKFSTEGSLWQLLRKSTHLGLTQVHDLNAAIVTDDQGSTNLQRALGVSPSADTPRLFPSTIILSDVNADLDLFSPGKPLSATITGLTKQESLNGSFEIIASFKGLEASDWEELQGDAQNYLSAEGSKEAKLQMHIINFPVDLIDRVVALKSPNLNGFFRSLLGDRLNLSLDKEPSSEGLVFKMTALSPLMEGSVKGQVLKGIFTLKEAALFQFNLTPDSINLYSPDQFELLEPSSLKLDIQSLHFPLSVLDNEKPIDIDQCQFSFQAKAKVPTAEVDVHPIGNLLINSLDLQLESKLCSPTISLKIQGEAQRGKEPFTIDFDTTLHKPKKFYSFFKEMLHQVRLSAKVSKLPLDLIPFLKEKPEILEQVGATADIQLALNQLEQGEWNISLSLKTPNIQFNRALFRVGKELTLLSPFKVDLKLPSNCIKDLLKEDQLALDDSCLIHLSVNHLNVPLDNQKAVKFQVDSTVPFIQMSRLSPLGIVKIQDLKLKVDGQNLKDFSTQLEAEIAILNNDGTKSPYLESPLKMIQSSKWNIESDGLIHMPIGRVDLSNGNNHAQIEGKLSSDKGFKLTQPAHIRYTLTPLALQSLSRLMDRPLPELEKSSILDLVIEPTSFNWTSPSFPLSRLHAKGTLAIDEIALKDATGQLPTLNTILLPWSVDGPMNTFSINMSGLAYANNSAKPSQLSAQITLDRWLKEGEFNPRHAKAEIQTELTNLPTSAISVLLTQHDLTPFLGPVMDLDFQTLFDLEQEIPGYWDMSLDSSAFHFRARLKFEQAMTLFDPIHPIELRWTVSPEGYSQLKKMMGWGGNQLLKAPATLTAYIPQINIPLKDHKSWADHGQFDLSFKTSEIQWQGKEEYPYSLNGQIGSKNISDHIDVACRIQSPSSSPLSLEGSLSQIIHANGEVMPWQEASFDIDIEAQKISSGLIQAFFLLDEKANQKIRALLGDKIEALAKIKLKKLNGPVQASLMGEQGSVQLDGTLVNGTLTLNTPLLATVRPTPFLAKSFLAQDVPLLSSLIGGEKPIKLTIDPKEFSCPLIPFDLEKIHIGKGVIDFGKIQFRNEGELSALLNLIYPIKDQQFTLWFTPLFFQMDQGKLTINRFDFLVAHAYALASWGNIDLKSHQMDLILGIPPQALNYAFKIEGLDEGYLLEIPLHTRKGKLEIDKKKLAARISTLIAQTQGGSKGKFLGQLLDMALSDQEGHQPPPPTTQPFPWAGEIQSPPPVVKEQFAPEIPSDENRGEGEVLEKKKSKKLKDINSEDIKKGLQQGASKVLDRLFGQ